MTDEHRDQHEQRREEVLKDAVQSYHRPPETPRERIWEQMQRERPVDEAVSFWPRFGGFLRTNWWPAVALGILVVGIWIGRQLEQAPNPPLTERPGTEMAAVEGAADGPGAVAEPLPGSPLEESLKQNAEALLMLVSSETAGFEAGGNEAVANWARELLSETRLLLGSPVAENEQTSSLLLDLEFVLVQLVRQNRPNARESNEWILDNIRRKDLLIRLRYTHSPPPMTGV